MEKKMDNIELKDKVATYLTQLLAFAIMAYALHFIFYYPGPMILLYAVISLVFQAGIVSWIQDKLAE
jgi:hypothetical protein